MSSAKTMTVTWDGERGFSATGAEGGTMMMDALEEFGGHRKGPTPLEAFLASAAACGALDVISILQKKKQKVTGYRLEVIGERTVPEGEWPRPFSAIKIIHHLEGENLDEAAVQRAIQLSDDKYCSVVATLRNAPEVHAEYTLKQVVSP
jgi:putative redox protein